MARDRRDLGRPKRSTPDREIVDLAHQEAVRHVPRPDVERAVAGQKPAERAFFIDGTEVTQIAINNGAGKYSGTDIPNVFMQARVGWNNHQSASPGFVA